MAFVHVFSIAVQQLRSYAIRHGQVLMPIPILRWSPKVCPVETWQVFHRGISSLQWSIFHVLRTQTLHSAHSFTQPRSVQLTNSQSGISQYVTEVKLT